MLRGIETALRESEQRFLQMAESVEAGFILREIGERSFVYANPGFLRIFGFDPAGPAPGFDEVTSLIHPDDRAAHEAASASVDSGRRVQIELRIVRADGEPRWIRFTGSPLTDGRGVVVRAAATLEDITSLKDVETALRESEQRFLQMAESVDAGFILREVGERSFVYANPGFLRIFGFDPAGPAPGFAEVTSLIHPDDRAAAAAAAARVEFGERVRQELRVGQAGGEFRWIRFTSSPVTDRHGKVIRVAATVEDVTAAKNAEMALRDSEERFQRTAGALQVGISLRQLDPARFLYVNGKYIQIVGFDPTLVDDAPPESALQRIHPDDRDAAMADYWQLAAAGSSARAEMRIVQPSGEIRWLRVTSTPVRTPPGTPALAAGTIEDITAGKLAEEALTSARRDAELANRAKSEFLSRMSHELRTPLNAVLGFAQLLELESPSDTQLDAIRHILRGGRHLLEMINDLLDISRIETDQLDLSTEPVAVADLLTETIGLMRPAAALQGITIRYDPEHPNANRFVLADRRRLRQVLLNLLSNAIKYNRQQGRIEIRCGLTDAAHLTIAITDTGVGIPADELHRLFKPFDRLGRENSDIEGTGIGLALSHRLAAIMGGRLEVESTPGRGSTFTIVMPLTQAPPTGNDDAPPTDHSAEPTGQPSATLLYIEDNRSNAELMTRILHRRPGWTMIHANNGSTGLHEAATSHPDLIFLDLHLPDANGIDVLRAIRADPNSAAIPLAIVSADANPPQIERLRSAGAQTYLTKPFQIAEILRLLDHHTPHRTAKP